MIKLSTTEETLIEMGYFKWTNGNSTDGTFLTKTPKFSDMIETLLKINPKKMITEKNILDYISEY